MRERKYPDTENETDWICLIWLGLKRHDDMIHVGKARDGTFWLVSQKKRSSEELQKKWQINEDVFYELCCSEVAIEDL